MITQLRLGLILFLVVSLLNIVAVGGFPAHDAWFSVFFSLSHSSFYLLAVGVAKFDKYSAPESALLQFCEQQLQLETKHAEATLSGTLFLL